MTNLVAYQKLLVNQKFYWTSRTCMNMHELNLSHVTRLATPHKISITPIMPYTEFCFQFEYFPTRWVLSHHTVYTSATHICIYTNDISYVLLHLYVLISIYRRAYGGNAYLITTLIYQGRIS